MSRLVTVLLACLFAVAPGADALCKAVCTPTAAAVPACHAMTAPSPDGALHSTSTCRRDVDLAVPAGDIRRAAPAPMVALTPAASLVSGATAPGRRSVSARPPRGRPTQAFPHCIVLRI